MQKRFEQRAARKQYRKMLKGFDIKKTLDQIEDYEAFYDKDEDEYESQAKDEEGQESEDETMGGVFKSAREA